MKLQKKSFLVIGLIWLGFIVFICATARYLLLSSYLKSEQEYVQRDLSRVDRTVNEINYSLFLFTSDWSHWNDLYDYMKGKKPHFIADNLSMSVYKDSSINMLTFWDNQGNMVYGTGVDTETNQFTNFPYGFGKYQVPRTLLLNYPKHPSAIHGYILSGDKIMLAAASAITNGSDNSQSVGTMITGRLITPPLLKKIGDISQTNLQLYTISEINGNPQFMDALQASILNNGHFNQPVNDKIIEGFSVINDIFGHPIGFFRMVKNRDIYASGLRAYHNFLTNFLIMALVFSVGMFALIRKVILRRLEKLDQQIADIRAHKKLAARVHVGGTDEVSDVANEFNALLDTIENLHQTYAKHTGDLKEENIKLNQAMTQFKKGDSYYPQPNDHLANLTNYDVLTSLPNRIFFNEIFNKSLLHSKENGKTLSILMLDVDKFHQINTTHGRPIGDMVLKELSSRIATILRPGDLLARLEGDEFIILLNDITHPKVASSIAEKVLQACLEVIKVDGHELFITVSIGISVYPNAAHSLEDMVKNAELALYKAKHAGGGVFQYFTEEMSHEKYEQLQLETALRNAITNNEFVLFYQPILNLKDGKINGVEALIRWKHPVHGMIDPNNFIPFAEKSGLIIKIGEWVIREVCTTNKRWQAEGYTPLPVSVNISPNQFKLQDISQLVAGILAETGLDAEYLDLEITESAFLDDDNETIKRLNDIREIGVSVAIDDFGTGRFSLVYLKKLHINTIKVDKCLIKNIPHSPEDEEITSAIIAMSHHLGVSIVAKGVETAEQVQYLFEHQCDNIQGYYISSPLPENKIVFLFTKVKNGMTV